MSAARRNPTRFDLVERIEELIAEYNAGSLNIDEYLRRLIVLSADLSTEERRAVVEDMTEEELAIFDLLTKPEPVLGDAEREVVKASAKRLLTHLHDKLVLDWRRKAAITAEVRTTISDVLDADLPADPYPPPLFDAKVRAVFDHIVSAYGDDGSSVAGAALRTVAEIIGNDEDFAVEFKSTARWDLREAQTSKAMEDTVKTVAGFLNTDGGTLLIGIGPDRKVVGLVHDYPRVKPSNGDGFVNWLTTHLTNAVGHAAVMRTRARIAVHDGHEICRLDVARPSQPVWAKTSKDDRVFFVRMNNSTRELPDGELSAYLADRWPALPN